MTRPSANATSVSDVLSFHTSYEEVGGCAHATSTTSCDWALHNTGATHHVFKDRSLFDDATFKKNSGSSKRLKLAGGDVSLNVQGVGNIKLKAGDGTTFELKDCLLVPDLSRNLVAGGLLKVKGVRELFDDTDMPSFSLVKGNLALFNGYIGSDNLMHLKLKPVSHPSVSVVSLVTDPDLAHRRLGHLSNQYLKRMCENGSLEESCDATEYSTPCHICSLSKATKLPFNNTQPRSKQFLENVHVDLSGIMRTKGIGNESYYALFTDDYSCYRHIYPLSEKSKEEVCEAFKSYIAVSERQTGCKLKQFTLDRGGEFLNSLLGGLLRELGITLHLTAGHTPAQNGVAERSNRTVSTKARCMMLESCVPLRFWYLACSTAVFLLNSTYTAALDGGKTPFEIWYFRKPSIKHLRIFGCQSFRLIRKEI